MERRKRFLEANEIVIQDMTKRLEFLREGMLILYLTEKTVRIYSMTEEIQQREAFYTSHGANLPDDLCLSITNIPTKWEVIAVPGDSLEVLPEIEDDLLVQVRMASTCAYH